MHHIEDELTLGYFLENSKIIFEIKDSGIGISYNDKNRIFDRLYIVNNKSIVSVWGQSIVSEICKKYSYSVILKDNKPRRTIFRIEF
ncbi:MAG: hypothetical protein PHE73_03715 [Sulfurovaceae bacterium]|nr:hypothetical protein [Sulfurovaceae bacterium]